MLHIGPDLHHGSAPLMAEHDGRFGTSTLH
jgi:hypothetical protein